MGSWRGKPRPIQHGGTFAARRETQRRIESLRRLRRIRVLLFFLEDVLHLVFALLLVFRLHFGVGIDIALGLLYFFRLLVLVLIEASIG
jgi:hypothetical protein